MKLKDFITITGETSLQCFNTDSDFLGIYKGNQIKQKLYDKEVVSIEINPYLEDTLSVFLK